ncbi:MAG: response regulator [Candidatus Aminicenantes bacterium]|nr:response regulator [Candidatus Aminicenantes bacterium]
MTTKVNDTSTILIVDDDRQVLKSLKIWFKNEGLNPIIASDSSEALKAVTANSVDVALVDLRMSTEDGISVSKKIRELDANIKIIIMTGFPSYETAVKAMKVGVTDYISKGSSNDKIMSVVRKALEGRRKEQGAPEKREPAKDRISFILFCNHSLIKERLETFSKSTPEFILVKSFPGVDQLKSNRISQEVDVALVCASCSIKTFDEAFDIFPELYRNYPGIKPVLINESFTDQEKVELLKLGIRGFFSADLDSATLQRALRHVKKGEIWVSRSVTYLSLKDMATYKTTTTALPDKSRFGLTDREIEILRTLVMGLKNKAIAEKLFISEKTVKTHVNRIFKKLGVANRTQAILAAMENKLV